MFLLLIILLIVFITVIWYICAYNSFQKSIVKTEEAKSGIDIALTKRFDVLTKLLDVVNQYTKHEKNILENVIKLRQQGASYKEINTELNKAQENINMVVENYPDLRSSEVYQNLQLAISDTEEHLSAARRFYNSACKDYNLKVRAFPTSIIANAKGYEVMEYFEAEDRKKSDVEMKFN